MPRVPPAVALTALLVVAGCLGGPAATEPTAVQSTESTTTESTTTDRTTRQPTSHTHFRSYTVAIEATTIAETESAWQAYVRDTLIRNLSALPVSTEARGVVHTSIENGSVHWEGTTETEPAKFRELSDLGGVTSVARNGTLYRITVRKVME